MKLNINLQPPCWRCWLVSVGALIDHAISVLTCASIQPNLAQNAANLVADGDEHETWN